MQIIWKFIPPRVILIILQKQEGNCMRKFLVLLMSATIALCSTFVSFAGEWKQDNVGWWYQNDDGSYVISSWKEIDGKQYYFDASGYILHDTTTPDGYQVDSYGAWIQEVNKANKNESAPSYKVYMNSNTNPKAQFIVMEYKNNSDSDVVIYSEFSKLYDREYDLLNRDLQLVEAGSTNVINLNSVTISPGERKMLSFSVKGNSTYYDKKTVISFILEIEGRAYQCMSSANGNSEIVRAEEFDDINNETK